MTSDYTLERLTETLAVSVDKHHAILTFFVKLYAQISGGKVDTVNSTLLQLDACVDYLHDDKNSDALSLLTQPVCLALAKNYALLLTKNKTRLFDTTNKLIGTFTEAKRPTALKNMSCVVLTAIYESFGREVVSFIPVLLITVLKYLKKETFEVNLSRLWYVIVRNGGTPSLTESLVTKYYKFLKHTESTEVFANLMGTLGFVATYTAVDTLNFKTTNHSVLQLGFNAHKKVRFQTAKALAEALCFSSWGLRPSLELYTDLYLDTTSHEQQIGLMQSLVHFTSMQLLRNPEFLSANLSTILETQEKLFDHERFQSFSQNGKYRILNFLVYYIKHISDLTGESTHALVLDTLIAKLDTKLTIWKTLLLLKTSDIFLSSLSSLSEARTERYRITIWQLCLSDNYDTQINAVLVLRQLGSKSPGIIKELLETSLNEVVNNTKQQSSEKIHIKSHGLALIIANLIALADIDYVPHVVIEQVWSSCTDLIKQNLKLTDANHHILSVCWISLSGVFTYHDKPYVQSLTSSFLHIWDSVDMTQTINKSPVETLTVISHALGAVLSLLKMTSVDSASAKTVVESLARLRPLATIFKATAETEALGDLITKRFYQIFLTCVDYIKAENSSILIQAVSSFSDLPTYETVKSDESSARAKDDGYSNGLSSKFHGFTVDELLVKLPTVKYAEAGDHSIDIEKRPEGSIELCTIKSWLSDSTWIDALDSELHCTVATSLEIDYLQPVLGQYSISHTYSPPSKTAIIDASMEIFSMAFPYLSTKVQLSLLETLRTHILLKSSNESMQISQTVNASIVIHGILAVAHQHNLTFDKQVGSILLETLRVLYTAHPVKYILTLNSESVGILISKTDLKEQIPIFLKKIIDEKDSNSRAFSSLVLSYIYRYNASHFGDILEMLLKLAEDGHPVVHAWSLDSLATIIERHVAMNTDVAIQVLRLLEKTYLDDKYGQHSSVANSNLNCDVDSSTVIVRCLRSIINSMGPAVKEELAKETKNIIENLIFGAIWLNNDTNARLEAIKLIQELIVYDNEHFSMKNVINILGEIIQGNLGTHIGSGLVFSVYEEKNEVFAMNSSAKTLEAALDLLSQLVKTSEDTAFISGIEPLIWIALDQFPDSKILTNMVSGWLNDTYDIAWFVKLLKLFNATKQQLYSAVTRQQDRLLQKHTHKKVHVDVKDEEAQSIANIGEESKGETIGWRFKVKIMEFLKQLLTYTYRDSKLYSQISFKVSELVKVSYASSTSSALPLRLSGIALMGDIIAIYAPAKDPIYPTMSLLEQQQAQIISALIPAFQEGSTPLIASEAIKVAATFIGSGIVGVSKLGRITRILTGALENLQHDDELKINAVAVTSQAGQRRIKLAVLNAWAELKILSDGQNEDLDKLIEEHMGLLLPLWVSSLKEHALLSHGKAEVDDDLFQDYWINLIDVVGCMTESDVSLIQGLLRNDALGFYYMLYAHCIYSLLKKPNRLRILFALARLLDFKELIQLIYHDHIFHESMEVIERLVVTGEESEQLILLDVTEKLVVYYFQGEENFTENADKLFDLVKLNLETTTRYIPNNASRLSQTQLSLVKKGLGSVSTMIGYFPDMIKQDLYACVLSIFAQVYTSPASSELVPVVLPVLKSVIHGLIEINGVSTVNNFYYTIRANMDGPLVVILTMSVLLETAPEELRLLSPDIELLVSSLIKALGEPEMVSSATECIKSLVSSPTVNNKVILRQLITGLVIAVLDNEDPRLLIELLIFVVRQYPALELYTIIVPLLVEVANTRPHLEAYIHKRLMSLININSALFKSVFGAMDQDQRVWVESLVKLDNVEEKQGGIKLKVFE